MYNGLALEVLHFLGINNSNLMNEREGQKEGKKGGGKEREREGERSIRKGERGREYSPRNYPHIPIS